MLFTFYLVSTLRGFIVGPAPMHPPTWLAAVLETPPHVLRHSASARRRLPPTPTPPPLPPADAGVGQLLAMTSLRHLSLACVGVADACWAVLAQLPALESLDLSNSRFSAGIGILPTGAPHAARRGGRHAPAAGPAAAAAAAERLGLPGVLSRRRSGSFEPPKLTSLTRLVLLDTKIDDTGCRRMAALLPR